MGLKDMTLLEGATIAAATGGNALSVSDDGVVVQGGVHLAVTSDEDITARRTITVKNRPATYDNKTGRWSKDKKSISLSKPFHTDGAYVFATIRIEREMPPSMTATEIAEFNRLAVQLLVGTDVDAFWATGSLS